MFTIEQKTEETITIVAAAVAYKHHIVCKPLQSIVFLCVIHNLLRHTAIEMWILKRARDTHPYDIFFCFQSVWLFDCAEFRLPDSSIEEISFRSVYASISILSTSFGLFLSHSNDNRK